MKRDADMIAVYSRKSKFTGKGESIGNQIELCREYVCSWFGKESLETLEVFEDEGFSGGNLKRPAFQKMMEAARKHRLKAIVVYRLDRISRNITDFTGLIDELTKLGVSFISIREQFDTSTPMGRAMMFIISVFSQLERETIAERIRDNMHELAKTGRWLGGNTPTGYSSESVSNVTVDGKTRKACKLKLIPEEAEIVKTIFDLYTQTDSLTGTQAELLHRGLKSKNGKDFTRFSIKAILQNPVYLIADADAYAYLSEKQAEIFSDRAAFDGSCGVMAYNRTEQEKGKSTLYLPMNQWIISVGKHEGLISAKQWIQVQTSLEQNKSKSYRKPRSNEALLTGLLFCACGSRMYPKLSGRSNADGHRVYSYVCKRKESSKREQCSCRNACGNALDQAVLAQVKLLAQDDQQFAARMEKSRRLYTDSKAPYAAKLAELKAQQAENEQKIGRLVDTMLELGESTARLHIAKRMEEIQRENRDMERRVLELESRNCAQAVSSMEFDLLRQLMAAFGQCVDAMTPAQLRTAVRSVVQAVVWDGSSAHVILLGADAGGKISSKAPWDRTY